MNHITPIPCEGEIPGTQPEAYTPRKLRRIQARQKKYDDGSTWLSQRSLMRRYDMTFAEWDALDLLCPAPLKIITLRYYGDHKSLLYNPRQIARRLHLLRTQKNRPCHD